MLRIYCLQQWYNRGGAGIIAGAAVLCAIALGLL
jgi:hypothetical protein